MNWSVGEDSVRLGSPVVYPWKRGGILTYLPLSQLYMCRSINARMFVMHTVTQIALSGNILSPLLL